MCLKCGSRSPIWRLRTLWKNFRKTSSFELPKPKPFLVKHCRRSFRLTKMDSWSSWNNQRLKKVSRPMWSDRNSFMTISMWCFTQSIQRSRRWRRQISLIWCNLERIQENLKFWQARKWALISTLLDSVPQLKTLYHEISAPLALIPNEQSK